MSTIEELLYDAKHEQVRAWIQDKLDNNKYTWEELRYAGKKDENELEKFLEFSIEGDYFNQISAEEWMLLVDRLKKISESVQSGFIGEPHKRLISIPKNANSCWVNYKKKISKPGSGFTDISIAAIEKSSQKIVTQIEDQTSQLDPVRGMVVGNVQSGKTANMAGTIAMAADYGFNFFIVLTGTIDNLRLQTRERLVQDLNAKECSLNFRILDNLSPTTLSPNRLSDLKLQNSTDRYLTVCLKNSTRLRELLNWLNKDQSAKAKLKVVLIDDESDQATINTKAINKEQTVISSLIKNIVFGRDSKDKQQGQYKCMNYIGYTATPYANFLNESGEETLYPKNFISLLNSPAEYFGPQQIFGIEGENNELNIVNTISNDEELIFKNSKKTPVKSIPSGLKDAILWFIITVACFRVWKLKKCVSMLIHTSQKISDHNVLADVIENYFKSNTFEMLLADLKVVYQKQVSMLGVNDLKEVMPEYPDAEKIREIPSFEDLLDEIKKVLRINITHIEMNSDKTLSYNEGLHLCVDNCSVSDSSIEMRIKFPDKTDDILNCSPAFIVIGGATLSRGLTLQGLTVSYFLRTTNQADTLMQMGRWFGYRKGYELLPRLWLPINVINKFERLALLDFELRRELRDMEAKGLNPDSYAPRLLSFPDYKLLIHTAKKKQQSVIKYQLTFYNKTNQTTWFYRDDEIINNNFKLTIDFLNSLGDLDENKIKSLNNPYVKPYADKNSSPAMWFDVDYNKVCDYLRDIKIPSQKATFTDIESFRLWLKKVIESKEFNNWTVMAGGVLNRIHNDIVLDNGIVIHLENRTRIEKNGVSAKDYTKYIDLSTISQSGDRLMDIDCSNFTPIQIEELQNAAVPFKEKRVKYASKNTPFLIIYVVDKDGDVEGKYSSSKSYTRYSLKSLNLENHLVGYYIYVPYGEGTNKGYITIDLKYEKDDLEDDVDDFED